MTNPNKKFSIKSLYGPTKRIRKIIQVGPDEESCCQILREQGYMDPFEVVEIFDDPTEAQMNYAVDLGISIPPDATKQDVSTLIDFKLENDRHPKPGLVEFATDNGLYFSKYIGEDALLDYVFSSSSYRSKTAFFIYCVYTAYTKTSIQNLNKSPHKMDYYAFADENEANERFIKSMDKYNGQDLRHFGEINLGDNMYTTGASKDTIAYKAALEFLKMKGMISSPNRSSEPTVKKRQEANTYPTSKVKKSKRQEQEETKVAVGCFSGAAAAIIFFIIWLFS